MFNMFNISPAQKQILKFKAKKFNISRVRSIFLPQTQEMLNFLGFPSDKPPKKFNISRVWGKKCS